MARKRSGATGRRIARPNQFRLQHGDVRRSPEPIVDDAGSISRPRYTAFDWLTQQLRKGKLLTEDVEAARRFRRDLRHSGYEQLRAVDLTRPVEKSRSAPVMSEVQEKARRRVNEAMEELGGWDDPSASIALHYFGFDMPIETWARTIGVRGCRIQPEEAAGLLLGAVPRLRRYYGL
jgi:hypothetical protein